MKKILLAALAALLCFLANAAETVRYTMRYKGEVRTYWLYVPEGAGPATPLVLVLHGYGGNARTRKERPAGTWGTTSSRAWKGMTWAS